VIVAEQEVEFSLPGMHHFDDEAQGNCDDDTWESRSTFLWAIYSLWSG
jgi:hypothetical protein